MLRAAALFLVVAAPVSLLAATDVTTPAARKQTLLEYVEGRRDLSAAERKVWDQALRGEFGGQAVKDGTDEGVTAAKSVVAAAIFHGIEPRKAAKAARDAYHDVYRFVPAPIAVQYQILTFTGRKPKASSRELAFDFPRYFDENLAVDAARWWDEALATPGRIPGPDRAETERALRETRLKMRGMLRDALWTGAELEARRAVGSGDEARVLDQMLRDLAVLVKRDYAGVGRDATLRDAALPYYGRYASLCGELGEKPQVKPVFAAPARAPERAPAQQNAPERTPVQQNAPERTPAQQSAPDRTQAQPDRAPAQARPERGQPGRPSGTPAPLPGPLTRDTLLTPPAGWPQPLQASVSGWLGTPYLWAGVDHRGIDCSAFVREVYRESLRIELPRVAGPQHDMGVPVEQAQLKPGDLVFFDTMDRGYITHVAVYVGDGKIAHASSSKGVTHAELAKAYYQHAYWGSRRYLRF
jgi:cell wall-associated NlpC family hydrolase